MRTESNPIYQQHPGFSVYSAQHRVRVILVDGSEDSLDLVVALLDCHDFIDLAGRAANVDEAIQLAENLHPDLILIDLDMPGGQLLIASLALLEAFSGIKVVALSSQDSVPLQAPQLILEVKAFIHKERFRQEFPMVFHALFDAPRPSPRISAAKLSLGAGWS